MNSAAFTFVDVETTGTTPSKDRIIEIGILRVENGIVTQTFESLVNPECHIPPEITLLTGITPKQLESAPSFYSLKDQVKDLFKDSIFVAHNARFDFSFIKGEFMRLEESFSAKTLCTVKLSRKLFPRYKKHSLDNLIERFGISCDIRHRAYADAKVLWEFFQIVQNKFTEDLINLAINDVTKTSAIPSSISKEDIDKLPENSGVYIFYDKKYFPLYIGKSINIKDRVLSHFYEFAHSTKEVKIFHNIATIETISTQGELSALLLESNLIKQKQPLYNRQLRNSQKMIALVRQTDDAGYFTIKKVYLSDIALEDTYNILAVSKSEKALKEKLRNLAKEYKLCSKLLGIEKTKTRCFGTYVENCLGACEKKETPLSYNIRFAQAFAKTKVRQWPFDGPIVIKEGESGHVVNHWRYLGAADDIEEDLRLDNSFFDYDTYKILTRFLLHKNSKIKVQKIELPKSLRT